MKLVFGFLFFIGVDAQCGVAAPVTCGASGGCTSCASCTSPTCYQTCCSIPVAPIPKPEPEKKELPAKDLSGVATCGSYTCPAGWQRTNYMGECPGGVCHTEMCCGEPLDCAHVKCPGGTHKKTYSGCQHHCDIGDCCEQEHTCANHTCLSGTRIHAAYPCPPSGCNDELCCDEHVIDVNCGDWVSHKNKCKKHHKALPPSTRCRHETCTHDECCKSEMPADCGRVNCPSNMIHVQPKDRLCGKYTCSIEDCCHEPRPCEKVRCPMFYRKAKQGFCHYDGAAECVLGYCDKRDCHYPDCCTPEPSCFDFECGATATKSHLGVCKGGVCNFAQCCTTITQTTTGTTCGQQPQPCMGGACPPPPQPAACVAPPTTCGCR